MLYTGDKKCTNNMEIGKILEYLARTAKTKEALIKTIKNMQKYNVKDEDIMKYTNTTLEELETIKKMKI